MLARFARQSRIFCISCIIVLVQLMTYCVVFRKFQQRANRLFLYTGELAILLKIQSDGDHVIDTSAKPLAHNTQLRRRFSGGQGGVAKVARPNISAH